MRCEEEILENVKFFVTISGALAIVLQLLPWQLTHKKGFFCKYGI